MKYQITVKIGSLLVNQMVVDSDRTNEAHLSGVALIVHPDGVFAIGDIVKISGRKRLSISATRYRAPKKVTG